MKIAQVSRGCFRYGGAGRVVWELSSQLVELGHEVSIFANIYEEVIGADFIKIPMLKAEWLKNRGKGALAKIPELYTYSLLAGRCIDYDQFDVVHVHGDSFAPFDVRTCHSCHRAWLESVKGSAKGFLPWIKKNANPYHEMVLALERYNLNNEKKRAIALSSQIKSEVLQYYNLKEERVSILPNGVDLETFNPKNRNESGRKIRSEHGIAENEPVLVFVGWEFRRKGLDRILRAMNKVTRQCTLLVIGGDNPRDFQQLAKELNLTEQVIFVGSTKEVPSYLAAADIFIFPTDYEAFSLAISEAAASGLAIITTDIAGASDLFTDGENALLLQDPYSVEELAAKLELALSDEELLQRLKAGARKAAEGISWRAVAKMHVGLYEEIVREKRLADRAI
jgi:UDP-glucose:(heptosyl)LPS alpha-1,3-glucosyltransferase